MHDVLINADLAGVDFSAGVRVAYVGAEGLRALERERGVAVEVGAPAHYRASALVTVYDDLTVERSRSSACRVAGPASDVRSTDAVGLLLVVEGDLRVVCDGIESRAGRGDLVVLRGGRPWDLRADAPFQLATLVIPGHRLPSRMLDGLNGPRGLVPPGRLAESVGAFLQRLSAGPAASDGPDRVYLARAMAELAVAVLTEAAGEEFVDDRSETLRARMRDHIDRNLSDPDLGPQQIAAALGVSVRYVHRVFNTGDHTVAKFIRERRLDAVARLLRSDARPLRVGALAARFGFSGRDHLTRAFRQQYGMTVREYQDAHAAEAAPLLARSGG